MGEKADRKEKRKCISEYARIAVAPLILRKVAIVSRNGGTKRKRKQRSAGRRTKTREYLSTHIWEGKASSTGNKPRGDHRRRECLFSMER